MDTRQSETAEQLLDVLADQTTWQGHARVAWFGPMLARIVLLAGMSEIEYVTGSASDAEGSVYAFTPHRVILARVEDTASESATPRVWTIPRRDLTTVELDTDASVFDPDEGAVGDPARSWPGSLSVVAHYTGGLELHLPGTTHPEERDRFNAFLPRLLTDLDHVRTQRFAS
jgi:hypothetical protein